MGLEAEAVDCSNTSCLVSFDSRYSFLPLPKCDRWWERAEKGEISAGQCPSGQNWSILASIADSVEVEFADLHAELRANQGSNKSGATSGWTGTAKGKDFDSAAGQPNDIACKGQPDLLSRLGSPQVGIRTEIDECVGRIES